MHEITNAEELLKVLKEIQGKQSQKEFANALNVSPQYLNDVYSARTPPGPTILDALGIQSRTVYSVPKSPILLNVNTKQSTRRWK
jgi:hypothetical protein